MTIRYERGDSHDVAKGIRTNTGTYVIVRRSLLHGATVTAYKTDGSVHWPSRPLDKGEEANHLRSGMWYDDAQRLPEGF